MLNDNAYTERTDLLYLKILLDTNLKIILLVLH